MALENEVGRYHAAGSGKDWAIQAASIDDLQRWSSDPNCIEQQLCRFYFDERLAHEGETRATSANDPESWNLKPQTKHQIVTAFDPRIEVSQDAKYIASKIVSCLWIIFVLIPVVLSILYELLK